MRHLLVSAAAVMAITGAAAVGNAQMQDKGPGQEKSPGAERAAPPSGGAQRAPGAGEKAQEPSNRSEQKSEPRKGAEREPGRDQKPRAAQQNEPQKDKSATQPQRDKDERKSTEQQRQRDQDKQKSTDQQRQRDQDKQKSADQQRQRDQDKQKSTDQRQRDQDKQKSTDQRQRDQDKQKSTDQRQRDQDKQKSTKGPDDKGARVQVSEEKRSGVRDRLRKEGGRVDRVNRTNINVSINVGSRIPRSVRLHTLPVSIVSFAPAYRGYSYILLEDETICIVDPNTYVIVDVIPAGSQRADRPGRTHLTLSQEDMRFIYRTVPKSRTADVRVRLALGAEVPRDVELIEFPAEVIERVPDVRRYRYIVTENDIVLVDPDDHAVALVINE
jgi:hypothetical protein